MTAKGKQWTLRDLRVDEVREHNKFQLRANGVDRVHTKKLLRTLQNGEELPPVKVVAINKALYLVDGYHRLEAYKAAHRGTIPAQVARMSLAEACEEAMLANTKHGLNLSRNDKAKVWEAFTEAGRHLEADGAVKASRTIEREINHVYSRETIRTKLKAMGLELNEGYEMKPWGGYGEPLEEDLEEELAVEAEDALRRFGNLFPTLAQPDQQRLLGDARALVHELERGEDGRAQIEALENPLDI